MKLKKRVISEDEFSSLMEYQIRDHIGFLNKNHNYLPVPKFNAYSKTRYDNTRTSICVDEVNVEEIDKHMFDLGFQLNAMEKIKDNKLVVGFLAMRVRVDTEDKKDQDAIAIFGVTTDGKYGTSVTNLYWSKKHKRYEFPKDSVCLIQKDTKNIQYWHRVIEKFFEGIDHKEQ